MHLFFFHIQKLDLNVWGLEEVKIETKSSMGGRDLKVVGVLVSFLLL